MSKRKLVGFTWEAIREAAGVNETEELGASVRTAQSAMERYARQISCDISASKLYGPFDVRRKPDYEFPRGVKGLREMYAEAWRIAGEVAAEVPAIVAMHQHLSTGVPAIPVGFIFSASWKLPRAYPGTAGSWAPANFVAALENKLRANAPTAGVIVELLQTTEVDRRITLYVRCRLADGT